MFSEKEILEIRNFIQSVNSNLIPVDQQEAVIKEGHIWCADWWTIEMGKILIYGEDAYKLDPLPRVLKNNHLFTHEYQVTTGNFKLNMLKLLKEHKDYSDTLIVCECGRGMDILLANMVKPWKKIYCYDHNDLVINEVNKYFRDKLGLPIEAAMNPSWSYDKLHLNLKGYAGVDFKAILLGNVVHLDPEQKEAIKNNPNILAIIDGEILK